MKHIFIVQSNITYLSALGVVVKENIALNDVWFVSEGFEMREPLTVTPLPIWKSMLSIFKSPLTYLNISREFDKKANAFCDSDNFTLYTPVMTNLSRVAFTNNKCKGLAFIEEGVSCYNKGLDIDNINFYYRRTPVRPKFSKSYFMELKRSWVFALRGFTTRLLSLPLHYGAYANSPGVRFYGFDESVFPLCDTRTVLSFHDIAKRFQFEKRYDLTGSAIWIGDDRVSCEDYPLADYIDAIKRGFIDCIETGRRVFVKFHPSEVECSKRAVIDLLRENSVEFEIIPDDVILEMELIDNQDVSLYSTYSSLLIYAAMMGCQSYTVHNYLRNVPAITMPLFKKLVACS